MKKFLILFVAATLVFMLGIGAYADEAEDVSIADIAAVVPETAITAATATAAAAEVLDEQDVNGTVYTLYSRLIEWYNENKSEIFSAVGSFIVLIASFLIKHRTDKKLKIMLSGLSGIKSDTEGGNKTQLTVIDAVNELVDGYNTLKKEYSELFKRLNVIISEEAERNRISEENRVKNDAILDILQTVYANSKNLPQGVKDIVALKYAKSKKDIPALSERSNADKTDGNT